MTGRRGVRVGLRLVRRVAWRLVVGAARLAVPPSLQAQFDTTGWRFAGEPVRVSPVAGRQALVLHDALAYRSAAHFRTGTIDFDVDLPDAPSFVGVQFRMQNAGDYEDYYFRPMSSGAPDATQYQPVFHGNTGWQLYVGPRYTAPLTFHPGRWTHVRLAVDDARAAVYVDDDTVAQYIPRLLGPTGAGMVAIYSRFAAAAFANVRIDTARVAVPTKEIEATPPPPGSIDRWLVSDQVIEERVVADRRVLGTGDLASLHWTARPTTERVFVNDTLRYQGDDSYRSRDPRFLGTVGLFDTIYLALHDGANTVLLVVSEGSGGWAVGAAFDPMPGVAVSTGTP